MLISSASSTELLYLVYSAERKKKVTERNKNFRVHS